MISVILVEIFGILVADIWKLCHCKCYRKAQANFKNQGKPAKMFDFMMSEEKSGKLKEKWKNCWVIKKKSGNFFFLCQPYHSCYSVSHVIKRSMIKGKWYWTSCIGTFCNSASLIWIVWLNCFHRFWVWKPVKFNTLQPGFAKVTAWILIHP